MAVCGSGRPVEAMHSLAAAPRKVVSENVPNEGHFLTTSPLPFFANENAKTNEKFIMIKRNIFCKNASKRDQIFLSL